MERHRSYMVTMWNKIPEENSKIKYSIGQWEVCPTTQKKHYQGYLELKNPMTMGALKKLLNDNSAHIEPRRGSQKSAIAYVTKEATRMKDMPLYEWGDKNNQGKRNDLEEAVARLKSGATINEIIDEIPSMLRLDKNLERYKQRQNNEKRNWCTEVIVLHGLPGSGKTRQVYEENKDTEVYVLPEATSAQWFDGYEGQDVVLIDDFEGTIRYNFLLQLCDRYPMRVNTKGGFVNWKPKKIYITSNKEPELWYGRDISALMRRITKCTEVAG